MLVPHRIMLAKSVTPDGVCRINAYGPQDRLVTFIYRVGVTRHITCEITGE